MRLELLPGLALLASACASHSPAGTPDAALRSYVEGHGGLRIHYVIDGTAGDTIVVLHGGPGLNLESVRPDLGPLARRYHVLYFDQRGGGYSGLPDSAGLTADANVEDLEAIRRAFHLERMTLLGHSWGGGLALLYAMRYPEHVSRLILVGSLPLRTVPWGQQYFATQSARRGPEAQARLATLDTLVRSAQEPHPLCREQVRLFLLGVAATPETAKRIRGDACDASSENIFAHPRVNGLVFRSIATDSTGNWDWRGQTAGITMPTLVVHGREDPLPLAGAEELTAALPNARLVVIPDAGHYPHAERPEAFFPPVEAFLDGN
jgi:proline iminopeptidase